MLLLQQIKSELLSQWNQTELAISDHIHIGARTETVETRDLPSIRLIDQSDDKLPEGNGEVRIGTHTILLEGYARTDSDIESLYTEVDRIISSKSIAGGVWTILNKVYEDQIRSWRVAITMVQQIFELNF